MVPKEPVFFIDKIEDLGIKDGVRFWKVKCNICKIIYKARASNVKHRKRTVCVTCSHTLSRTIKGGSKVHPLYTTWSLIKRRVDNTSVKKLSKDHYYDGINICEEWKDFKVFVKWSKNSGYKKGLTIDRKNSDKDYCPSNCRWTDLHVQASNKNPGKNNTTGYRGVSLSGRKNTPYTARVSYKNTVFLQNRFTTLRDAVNARNFCIKENSLPHPIQQYKEK